MACSHLKNTQALMPASLTVDECSTSVHRKALKFFIQLHRTFCVCQSLSSQTFYIIQSQKATNPLPYYINIH